MAYTEDPASYLSFRRRCSVRLWHLASGKQLSTPDAQGGTTNGALYFQDSRRILSWGKDSLRIWDKLVNQPLMVIKHDSDILGAIVNKSGSHILTWEKERMRLLEVSIGRHVADIIKSEERIDGAAFSKDGNLVLTWGNNGAVLRKTSNGQPVGEPIKHDDWPVLGAELSLDKKHILTWSNVGIKLWKFTNNSKITSVWGYEGDIGVKGATFSKDGNRILLWGSFSGIRILEISSNRPSPSLTYGATVDGATFSKDGKIVLSWGYNSVRLWDVSKDNFSNKPLYILEQEGHIYGAAFNHNESRIISWNSNGILLWNMPKDKLSNQPLATLNHDGFVFEASFNQDGRYILSRGEDGVRLWESSTGQPLSMLMKHKSEFKILKDQPLPDILKHNTGFSGSSFSKDENEILSWSPNGIRTWNIEVDLDLPKELFNLQTKALTGTYFNQGNLTVNCLSVNDWERMSTEYFHLAQKHYKDCKYSSANLWSLYYPEEAEKSSKGKQLKK